MPPVGGTLDVIAGVIDPGIIQKILDHAVQPPPHTSRSVASS